MIVLSPVLGSPQAAAAPAEAPDYLLSDGEMALLRNFFRYLPGEPDRSHAVALLALLDRFRESYVQERGAGGGYESLIAVRAAIDYQLSRDGADMQYRHDFNGLVQMLNRMQKDGQGLQVRPDADLAAGIKAPAAAAGKKWLPNPAEAGRELGKIQLYMNVIEDPSYRSRAIKKSVLRLMAMGYQAPEDLEQIPAYRDIPQLEKDILIGHRDYGWKAVQTQVDERLASYEAGKRPPRREISLEMADAQVPEELHRKMANYIIDLVHKDINGEQRLSDPWKIGSYWMMLDYDYAHMIAALQRDGGRSPLGSERGRATLKAMAYVMDPSRWDRAGEAPNVEAARQPPRGDRTDGDRSEKERSGGSLRPGEGQMSMAYGYWRDGKFYPVQTAPMGQPGYNQYPDGDFRARRGLFAQDPFMASGMMGGYPSGYYPSGPTVRSATDPAASAGRTLSNQATIPLWDWKNMLIGFGLRMAMGGRR